jgi:hypothetical protein
MTMLPIENYSSRLHAQRHCYLRVDARAECLMRLTLDEINARCPSLEQQPTGPVPNITT